MQISQITAQSISEEAAKSMIQRVAESITQTDRPVQLTEYAQSVRVNGADGGRIFSGKRTIVITVDGGDPNLEIEYLEAGCCG